MLPPFLTYFTLRLRSSQVFCSKFAYTYLKEECMETFGIRLRELRNERGLSSKALGKEIGVSDATIIRWENASMIPGADYIALLAKYFKVSSDYLLGLED